MSTGMRFDMSSIEMNTGAPDANGVSWYCTEVEGWDASPIRGSVIEPTGVHGAHVASGKFAARPLTVRGVCKAPTRAKFWDAYNYLSEVTSSMVDTFPLKGYEPALTKRMHVVLNGQIRKAKVGQAAFGFEVPLLAPDPFKYSEELEDASLVGTINNPGTFESYPRITLVAGGAYEITNTTQGAGAALRLSAVPAGTIVDMRRRTVLAAGITYYSAVDPTSVWWTLLPGDNVLTKTGGDADIEFRPAWL